ncbi:MAG: hypothetical protein HY710_09770 [Candidatus Latescibacteria bacterium]|nr:hypothetical protein [Candidatus Latescibacterota bacterium]
MRVYVEGETLLIEVSERQHEESLDVFIVDHEAKQRIEGHLTISPKRAVKLTVDRRITATPVAIA